MLLFSLNDLPIGLFKKKFSGNIKFPKLSNGSHEIPCKKSICTRISKGINYYFGRLNDDFNKEIIYIRIYYTTTTDI